MTDILFDDVMVLGHHYPFWVGPTAETYLEGEVAVIAAHAKRVYAVAFEGMWNGAPLRRHLPDNVEPIMLTGEELSLDESWRRRLPQMRSLFTEEFLLDRSKVDGRDRLRAFFSFMRDSEKLSEVALRRVRERCPSFGSGRTLLYSFWFNEPSRAAILMAERMCRETGRKPVVISRAHGYDCYDYRSDVGYLPCKAWMALHQDRVYPCSWNGAEHLRKGNPRAASCFEVGYLGTLEGGLGPVPSKEDPLLVATCSRAVPLKRLDRVAAALGLLASRGVGFRWFCIGDGETLSPLKEQVERLDIADSVEFLGALEQDEVFSFYRNTPLDVFVNASEVEGVPLSIMEAQSFGVPAVATAVGGNPEIVLEGVTGCLVPVDFSDGQLAEALLRAAARDSPSLREGARRNWENRFSLERNADALLRAAVGFVK